LGYYPKGRLIKSLIEEYVTKRVIDYGGMEVETPIMYDMNNPILEKYLQKFPARQYQIESDKKRFFLRILRRIFMWGPSKQFLWFFYFR